MVAEILLHIGMHKTGTTALQTAIAGFDDGRVRFARLGHPNHSIPFVTCFTAEPHRYHVWQRMGATREQVAERRASMLSRLDAELALPHDRLLVVGEEIGFLNSTSTAALAQHLRRSGCSVSLLAYLRDPAGYVTSAFQQQVRGGQSGFTLPRPWYRQRFEKFLSIFGPDALTFRLYAPDRFAGHSVVADYCMFAGISGAAVTDCHVNSSLPLEAVRLIHLFNRTGPATRSGLELDARSALIKHLTQSYSARFTLDPSITAAAIDPDELDWLERVSQIRFDPQPAPTDRDTAEAALAAMLADFDSETHDRLRSDLALRGVPSKGSDTLTDLLGALYLHFRSAAATSLKAQA